HAGELDHMLHLCASGGFDKSALPLNKTLGDGREQERFFHVAQSRAECLRLIEVPRRQFDIRPFEISGLVGIAHERAHLLPERGGLSDNFLSVSSSCSSNQYHSVLRSSVICLKSSGEG